MTEDEREQFREELLASISPETPWWWFSFSEEHPSGFLGVAIVQGRNYLLAHTMTCWLGLNPGGAVRAYQLDEPPSERFRNRLLNKREVSEVNQESRRCRYEALPAEDREAIEKMAAALERRFPGDGERSLVQRASTFGLLAKAWVRAGISDDEDVICDLTCDARHWADREVNGHDKPMEFDEEMERGRRHYEQERGNARACAEGRRARLDGKPREANPYGQRSEDGFRDEAAAHWDGGWQGADKGRPPSAM